MSSQSDTTSSSYKHILKYTGVFGGVQLLNILIALVRNKFVAQLLGPHGFGLVALFNSTVKFISDATSFGIPTSAVKELAKAYENKPIDELHRHINSLRNIELLSAILGIVACVLFGGLISELSFSESNHIVDFILLSPVVGCTAIIGGELALLKATHQLKALTRQSLEATLIALIVTLPILYFLDEKGIVLMLDTIAVGQMITVLRFSCRHYPYRVRLSLKLTDEVKSMLRLGVAFVVAGLIGSASELAIRAFLSKTGDLHTLGLYNAAYMIVVTYAGMAFSAMETDYYPRLSGVKCLGSKLNAVVNRQMEVSFLIIAPMVVAMLVGLPIILPMLFSREFMPVLPMLQVAALSMYFRALYLPVEYISLARGDWRSFVILEAISCGIMLLFIIVGYSLWGLLGCGISITAAYITETIVVAFYGRRIFCFHPSRRVVRFVLVQLPLGAIAFCSSTQLTGIAYWLIGIAIVAISSALSLYLFRRVAKKEQQ